MNLLQRIGAALSLKRAPSTATSNSSSPVFAPSWADGRPVTTNWDPEKAVTQGLKENVWVYAACRKVATAFASVPLVLEKLVGDAWTSQPSEPLQTLLNQPNAFMARQDVMERWAYHMLLAGNALWLKVIAGGVPGELWPVLPQQIKPIPDRMNFLAGYQYRPTPTDIIPKRPDEVLHWMFVDPLTPYWGLAPLQAAARAVDNDTAAAIWQTQLLKSGGRPSIAVLLEKALKPDEQRMATALINESISSGGTRAAAVFGGASKVQPLNFNATELDYLNSRKFTREEVASAFGVPPVLLSFGEAATYANLDAAKTALWEDCVVPLLDDFTQGLMASLFSYWRFTQDKWRIRADLSGVRALQSNLGDQATVNKTKADTLLLMVQAGVPLNMARAFLDLDMEDVPGGDEPRAPVPTGQPPPQAKARFQRKDKGDTAPDAQLARRDGWEAQVRKKVSELLTDQGSTYAAAYVDGTLDKAIELSVDDWQKVLAATHEAVIESEGSIAYMAALKSVTGSGGGSFDVLADGVKNFIQNHVGDSVKSITDTTKQGLRDVVNAGVQNGDSTATIAKAIKAQMGDWSDTRATLVARTEVATAFGAAHQEAASQLSDEHGVEMVKTWNAVDDARTRPEHAAMNGETVGIKDSFSNGLDFPGEPNCRCVCVYAQKEV